MIKKILSLVDQKLLRFIIVGCINTVVGTAIMFGLYNLASCSYWVSSAANYILTSILSYILNKTFTFGNKDNVGSTAVRFALNIAVCYLLAYGIAKPAVNWMLSGASVSLRDNCSMFAGLWYCKTGCYVHIIRRRSEDSGECSHACRYVSVHRI